MSRPSKRRTWELRADRDTPVRVVDAGTVPYGTAWDWQRDLVRRRGDDRIGDTLLLLEHPRVFTAGRRADRANLVFDEAERARRGIELFDVDRGGDFTYHGPGQLVGYPILQLDGPNVVDYVRAIEEILIRTVASYGLEAERIEGLTGVWVGDEKVAAIGIRVTSGYVTSHGFALNVRPDLVDFAGIVPCGIADRGVCSLSSLGIDTTVDETAGRVREAFAEVLGCSLEEATADDLGLVRDTSASA